VSSEIALSGLPASGEPLVKVKLVPVEVFGADVEHCRKCGEEVPFGYGLMDAVPAWSDCNRALGRIYRADEASSKPYREPGDTITVYVPESEMAKFQQRYGDDPNGRCPACHVPYDELPKTHRVTPARPVCETPLPHAPDWDLLPFGGRRSKPPWKCRWHGWIDDRTCLECKREHGEYLERGTWEDRRK
jgi:hypothetical protein